MPLQTKTRTCQDSLKGVCSWEKVHHTRSHIYNTNYINIVATLKQIPWLQQIQLRNLTSGPLHSYQKGICRLWASILVNSINSLQNNWKWHWNIFNVCCDKFIMDSRFMILAWHWWDAKILFVPGSSIGLDSPCGPRVCERYSLFLRGQWEGSGLFFENAPGEFKFFIV